MKLFYFKLVGDPYAMSIRSDSWGEIKADIRAFLGVSKLPNHTEIWRGSNYD